MKYEQVLAQLHQQFMGEEDMDIEVILADRPGTEYKAGDRLTIGGIGKSPTGIVVVLARRDSERLEGLQSVGSIPSGAGTL